MKQISTVFSEIYQTTYEKVRFFILMKCGKVSEVEDILQETYEELFSVLMEKGPDYITTPEGFVIQLAKSKIYRYYSEKARKKACVYAEPMVLPGEGRMIGTAGNISTADWEDVLIDKLTAKEVMEYISEKDELTKEIFFQHYFADKTLSEIAENCGVKESTVKNRLYRTLKELRKMKNMFCILFVVGLLGVCFHVFVLEKEDNKQGKTDPTVNPTPTMCPAEALPTIRMNGKLYKVETIGKNDAAYDLGDLVGSVEHKVGLDKTPVQELESNILPVGTKLYKYRYSDDIYIAVVIDGGKEVYYRVMEVK